MAKVTLLSIKISDVELLADYASRSLTAELEYIPQAESFGRGWNAGYIDFSMPQFKKFQMVVTADDFESNGLASVPPGTLCTVECLPDLGVARGVDDSSGNLTMQMRTGRWKESRNEKDARTVWSLPLYED